MAPRGPKPEPAAVKIAKGNSGRRRIGKDPETNGGAAAPAGIQPPPWLSNGALKIWQTLVPNLALKNLMSQDYAQTFGRYCEAFAEWLACKVVVEQQGRSYSITTESGTVVRTRPEWNMMQALDKTLERAEANFGLNPAERQRIFAMRASGGGAGVGGDLVDRMQAGSEPAPAPAASPLGLLNGANRLN